MRARMAVAVVTLLAGRSEAQTTVRGTVYDSLGRAPLGGAMVQLVGGSGGRTATADSLGRFAFGDVADGKYMVSFFHPILDSLALQAPLREVVVANRASAQVDVALPSPVRLRAAICCMSATQDTGAIVIGIVRTATDGAPAEKASVAAQWAEMSISKAGTVRRMPRVVATTGDNGWFAICNVPRGGQMSLEATRGADSSEAIDVQVPNSGYLRRELFIAPTRRIAMGDSRIRVGDGRVTGTVISAADKQPLANARVGIANGPQARTNERGEFSITNAPLGTRMLDVRALGYYPEHRDIDVEVGGAPVRVSLMTMRSVLDTIKVTARAISTDIAGFEQRSQTGAGRYYGAEFISRFGLSSADQVLKRVPGLKIVHDFSTSDDIITMRSASAVHGDPTGGSCSPNVYVNNVRLGEATADDIDSWAPVNKIIGIEVYNAGFAPPQFSEGMSSCGSIVIWTKR